MSSELYSSELGVWGAEKSPDGGGSYARLHCPLPASWLFAFFFFFIFF